MKAWDVDLDNGEEPVRLEPYCPTAVIQSPYHIDMSAGDDIGRYAIVDWRDRDVGKYDINEISRARLALVHMPTVGINIATNPIRVISWRPAPFRRPVEGRSKVETIGLVCILR